MDECISACQCMVGWVDGWINGEWINGTMEDRWIEGMDRWMNISINKITVKCSIKIAAYMYTQQ